MSYLDQAKLYTDPEFQGRLQAAVTTESRGRLPGSAVAGYVMENPGSGMFLFLPWVTSEPGFDVPEAQVADGMILSAVQSVWDQVEAQGVPEPPA